MSVRTWIFTLLAVIAGAALLGSLTWGALGGPALGDGETLLLPALVVTVVGLIATRVGPRRVPQRVRTRRQPPR